MSFRQHKRSASIDVSTIHHPHMLEEVLTDSSYSPGPRRQSIAKVVFSKTLYMQINKQ